MQHGLHRERISSGISKQKWEAHRQEPGLLFDHNRQTQSPEEGQELEDHRRLECQAGTPLPTSRRFAVNIKSKPVRLQYRRTKGFKLVSPNGLPNICVDRRSKWGNPFVIGETHYLRCPGGITLQPVLINQGNCLQLFREYAEQMADIAQTELRGKNLVCWCKIKKPCHADIWLEIANR